MLYLADIGATYASFQGKITTYSCFACAPVSENISKIHWDLQRATGYRDCDRIFNIGADPLTRPEGIREIVVLSDKKPPAMQKNKQYSLYFGDDIAAEIGMLRGFMNMGCDKAAWALWHVTGYRIDPGQ